MHWTRVWTTLFALLHCCSRPAAAAIRVLAFPKSQHVPVVHPTVEGQPDAPDLVACLRAMSYTCLQRKTVVYLDQLNRLDRIRLLGDFVTAVRTQPVSKRTPRIDERLLDARGFNDILSLSVLVNTVWHSIVHDHVLRISFPRLADLGDAYARRRHSIE